MPSDGMAIAPQSRHMTKSQGTNATGIGIARAPDGRLFYTQLYVTYPR